MPEAEFSSYYGRPIVKEPTWQALDIAGYLFLGGLAGASSALGAGAQLTGRHALARPLKLGAAGAISLSLVALVHDLGRPARFLYMLRVFKPTSPMSVGVWLLSAYAPAAGLAAAQELVDLGPLAPLAPLGGAVAGLLGPAVASYTAVLIANTATPAWHEARRELPFVVVGSAAAAAGGLGLAFAPARESGPARRLALLGALCELTAMRRLHSRVGLLDECYRSGRAGRLVALAEGLTAAGGALAALGLARRRPRAGARRSRLAAVLGGSALLAGSACARFGIFEAGLASTRDPRYTVSAQREKLREDAAG